MVVLVEMYKTEKVRTSVYATTLERTFVSCDNISFK